MESLSELWDAACTYIKTDGGITSAVFSLWLAPLQLTAFDGEKVTLTIDNEFKYGIVTKKFTELLEQAFFNALAFPVRVEILLVEKEKEEETPVSAAASTSADELVINNRANSFENFVVGKSNNYAYAAAKKVAENPGKTYNPLFIYGKSGLGKTHLLKAIENYMKSRNPDASIIYVTSENFTNDIIEHVRFSNNPAEMREKYRRADALLVDDIQFIAGKNSIEEEFFHTFNALTENGKQIVLSSDNPPNEIPKLTERLKNRFEWGLMADIQPPDFEMRMAIIKNKADALSFSIPDAVVEFIAEQVSHNVRQLEGAVKKLQAICVLLDTTPTIEITKDAIKELMNTTQPVSVVREKILEQVSAVMGVSVNNITSDKRDKNIKDARQMAMYIIREMTGMSLEEIGKCFNGKTHSTVKHSIDSVADKMDKDKEYKGLVENIIKNVQEI
ncbi:MAG: chromosomal replication initiator protein DnaA [Ruminococcus sp.]|nr:chromosomal replication initiator protein DnaA [Ruminococcus sp.]